MITITIGANDILACDPAVQVCVQAQLTQLATNLPQILQAINQAAPEVSIVGMNYYNPNLAYWLTGPAGIVFARSSNALAKAFNDALAQLYTALAIPFADVSKLFRTLLTRPGDPPRAVRNICRYTQICVRTGPSMFALRDWDPETPGVQADIHPSRRGHRLIAAAFMAAMRDAGIILDTR